ncbi:MAG: DNA repair protein RecN [Chloroflexota bacterium]
MLLELRVSNLGIIEEIKWSLSCGFNVITGETGAGKSLVIDALEVLLGGRAGEEAIRHGAEAARIEGVFAISPDDGFARLREALAENGLPVDEETLVVQCELRRQGRSTTRVNGQAVPKGIWRQIGRGLIDIHGQSEHLSLLDRKYHLDFLDAYAGTLNRRQDFTARAAELARREQEWRGLTEGDQGLTRREEFLRFQIDEIRQADLRDGEEAELEKERDILAAAETLKELSYAAGQVLDGEDSSGPSASARDRLQEAVQIIRRLVEYDPALGPQLEFLTETAYRLEETARDIRAYRERLENDPQRLEEVASRLELIRSLKRKYGDTVAGVLAYLVKVETELAGLVNIAQRQAELEAAIAGLKTEMGRLAGGLSTAREKAARRLVAAVQQELQELNMAAVTFDVAVTQLASPEGIPLPDGQTYRFGNEGVDTVEFLASTNPGEPIKPLAAIASTGEISRFMLALKGALARADRIPVLVFDEIDIGVGGRSGEVIGKKLWALARDRQVICVTHLPQIAVFADAHYSVHKEVSGERSTSRLEAIQDEARLKELAVMLAGAGYSQTSLDGARELLQRAEAWKQAAVTGAG